MTNQIEFNTSVVFESNYNALFNSDKQFIVNQGSSRSSKTYSICQLLILYAITNPNKVVTVIRKSLKALKGSAYRDIITILQTMDLYDIKNHNKTDNIYTFPNGSMIEFIGVDDPQKLRGRKRDIAYINEATEIHEEDFLQIKLRTGFKIIIDYNPSTTYGWFYDIPDNDKVFIKSTYKDNPFLEKQIIKSIEDLQYTDEDSWRIFGLGEKSISKERIYTTWTFLDKRPETFVNYIYSIDFGYTHPTAIVKIWYNSFNEIFIEPLLYETHLDPPALQNAIEALQLTKTTEMTADYARPELIADIANKGYYIFNADKAVEQGILNVKSFKVYALEDRDLIKEYENYKYKKVQDRVTEAPVKILDDYMDAIRYGCTYIKNNLTGFKYDLQII